MARTERKKATNAIRASRGAQEYEIDALVVRGITASLPATRLQIELVPAPSMGFLGELSKARRQIKGAIRELRDGEGGGRRAECKMTNVECGVGGNPQVRGRRIMITITITSGMEIGGRLVGEDAVEPGSGSGWGLISEFESAEIVGGEGLERLPVCVCQGVFKLERVAAKRVAVTLDSQGPIVDIPP